MSRSSSIHPKKEVHRSQRVGWLRAAVLGANDGVISTSGLVVGVAAAGTDARTILLTGVAGLISGMISMAAGEYVSVKSQADTEDADLAIEKKELESDPEFELAELAAIYVKRGIDQQLANQVAKELMDHNALEAHARDELGITDTLRARPVQAAAASAASFVAGAIVPIIATLAAPTGGESMAIFIAALASLAVLGSIAAYLGGASMVRGAARVMFWGATAMIVTYAIGKLFDASGV